MKHFCLLNIPKLSVSNKLNSSGFIYKRQNILPKNSNNDYNNTRYTKGYAYMNF